jgi:mevalonate kinase
MSVKDYIRIDVPAKTFFLGEYSVLRGKNALVLTHGPVFIFKFLKKQNGKLNFHPNSLAGKISKKHQDSIGNYIVEVSDPYNGIGGLGLSSAEFIAAWMFVDHIVNDDAPIILSFLMEEFFELTNLETIKPSGVDIVAQCQSKCFNKINSKNIRFESVNWPFKDYGIVLFHTLSHCSTHDHLSKIQKIPDELLFASDSGIKSLENNNLDALVYYINKFVDIQNQAGLLAQKTKDYIKLLNKENGVIVAKGCGAMGADVIAVIVDKKNIDDINKFGQSIGLTTLVRDFDFKQQFRVKKYFHAD